MNIIEAMHAVKDNKKVKRASNETVTLKIAPDQKWSSWIGIGMHEDDFFADDWVLVEE